MASSSSGRTSSKSSVGRGVGDVEANQDVTRSCHTCSNSSASGCCDVDSASHQASKANFSGKYFWHASGSKTSEAAEGFTSSSGDRRSSRGRGACDTSNRGSGTWSERFSLSVSTSWSCACCSFGVGSSSGRGGRGTRSSSFRLGFDKGHHPVRDGPWVLTFLFFVLLIREVLDGAAPTFLSAPVRDVGRAPVLRPVPLVAVVQAKLAAPAEG